MTILKDLLPVLVTLLPFALMVLVVAFFNRKAAKKVAVAFGIIFVLLLVIEMVVTLGQGNSNHLDTEEKDTVRHTAERDFRDNFVRIDVPIKPVAPFTKAEYIIVVNNYENQDEVDNFIFDACDKLENKSTNLKVQPLHQTASEPKLIDRACNVLQKLSKPLVPAFHLPYGLITDTN